MNTEDSKTFQDAIQLARAGQTRRAYERFCLLATCRVNRNHPDLLLWIAETSPSFEEAQRAINEANSIAPYHPGLLQAQNLLARRSQSLSHKPFLHIDDTYSCPFCGTTIHPVIVDKVSSAGWIIFILLIVCLVTIEFCWLGLFLRQTVVQCPMCNNNLQGFL